MKINQWFNGKVIPAHTESREALRQELFDKVDQEVLPLHEFPAICPFAVYIWCVDDVWYWSEEDLSGDIYVFPTYLNGVELHVIESFMAVLNEAYESGIVEGKRRKICQYNRLMSEFKNEASE